MPGPARSSGRWSLALLFAIGASLLPFARILIRGEALYFRDLSGQFFPTRTFVLEGLRNGELRFWNPFVHEGVPLALTPLSYPLDLLQLLRPDEVGLTVSLILHLPLAAAGCVFLGRRLGWTPAGAVASALVYTLGGFALSTLNLYVYTQTLAWVPYFILAFRACVEEAGGRSIAAAAASLGLIISTTGVEIGVQGCLLALLVTPPLTRASLLRAAAAGALGIGLAAAAILPVTALVGDSERGAGFATTVVLSHSVHPLVLPQAVFAGFLGDPANLTGAWWGSNFFPQGFPYILTLYLGPTVVGLALAAALQPIPLRRRLAFAAVLGIVISLGRYAGWDSLLDAAPFLRVFRYPVKAYFLTHAAAALLAGAAVSAMESTPGTRRAALAVAGVGAVACALASLPWIAPGPVSWFLGGFLPPGATAAQRLEIVGFMSSDAAAGGLVALLAASVAWAAARGRWPSARAAAFVTALAATDLIRAGAGVNPSVTPDFFALSPEMAREADDLRRTGGRAFTCDPLATSSYRQARRARVGRHEAFSLALGIETFTPDSNVRAGVRTALSIDRTMLAPRDRVLEPEQVACRDAAALIPRLRSSGVTRVFSVEPLSSPELSLLRVVSPARISPLGVHVYEVSDPRPRFSRRVELRVDEPGRIVFGVALDEPGEIVVREPAASGWTVRVDGRPSDFVKDDAGHRRLRLPSGASEVAFDYEPPGLARGVVVAFASFAALVGLCLSGRRPSSARGPST